MNNLTAALVVTIVLMVCFTAIWGLALRLGKWSIVDPFWSFSVGLNATLFAVLTGELESVRQWLICAICVAYSARLGGHLLARFLQHQEDDPRYTEFAREWGSRAKPRMLLFFQFQAIGGAALCIPIFVAIASPSAGYTWTDALGIAIGLLALVGEALADRQLRIFKSRNHKSNEVCKAGLWRYSRHPNYFFQWMFWLSFVPMGIASNWWWLTLISPILMYHFLNNVTGIPPTEKRSIKSKGDAYRRYQRETSSFFPLPQRKLETETL